MRVISLVVLAPLCAECPGTETVTAVQSEKQSLSQVTGELLQWGCSISPLIQSELYWLISSPGSTVTVAQKTLIQSVSGYTLPSSTGYCYCHWSWLCHDLALFLTIDTGYRWHKVREIERERLLIGRDWSRDLGTGLSLVKILGMGDMRRLLPIDVH